MKSSKIRRREEGSSILPQTALQMRYIFHPLSGMAYTAAQNSGLRKRNNSIIII